MSVTSNGHINTITVSHLCIFKNENNCAEFYKRLCAVYVVTLFQFKLNLFM